MRGDGGKEVMKSAKIKPKIISVDPKLKESSNLFEIVVLIWDQNRLWIRIATAIGSRFPFDLFSLSSSPSPSSFNPASCCNQVLLPSGILVELVPVVSGEVTMPSQEDIVRAAVQLALRNDAAMECEPSTPSEVASLSEPQKPKEGKEKQKKVPNRKQKGKAVPDSNWKVLQKSLEKPGQARKHHAKRPRTSPKTFPSTAHASSSAKFSSFMKRRVTSTDELSRVVAIDCEMVGIGPGGKENALARVSVVNYSGDVLYDSFVRVHQEVTDYRTEFSGVRVEDVAPDAQSAAEPFEVQKVVGEIIKGRVLVGHAIRNDLDALRLKHPWKDVRDTSEFYKKLWRRTKSRRSARGPALRVVVASVLGVDAFQKQEHDSCEDARAALMLYKKNAKAWEAEIRAKGVKGGRVEKGKKAGAKPARADGATE